MSFDYVVEGPPIQPVPAISCALLLDKINNNLYIANGIGTNWVLIQGSGGLNTSIQNITTNATIGFLGAVNTFIKATAGSGGITLNLPSAIGPSGQVVTVMQVDPGLGGIIIQPDPLASPEQFINGTLIQYELTNQYQTVSFISDNADWFVCNQAG